MHAMSLTVVLLMTLYSSLLRAYRPDGYVGCFKDKKDRILKGKHRESKTNSGDECKRYCMSYRYRYAGTKKEDECYCGHTIPVQELLYICNHKCPGNHEEICGGRSTISVYDTWYCATSPCKNGATCEDIDARSYNCICFGEWTGKNCDKETETTTLETSSLSDKTQLSTRIKITTHFPNIKTTDKSESNIAEYVLVPVALVVLIAITVAVVCIKRRRAAKNVRNGVSSELATTNKQPKHREVGNASCNDYKVKSTPYSYCSTSRTSTYFNSGYVDIEPDGCDNKQNKYNHLTIQTLPYFDNTYSHLKANQNNISWISDITYSHLDNENSPTETTEDIDTYNRLQVNTSNGMKRFQDESDCDTDYSHLDARAQKTEIDADDYSHINYKSPEKNKEHSSSDLSGNTHELAIVETSDGEIRHDYFVLEKIS
ncbi:uncharacterized protein LOC123551734 isoform X1 [Mercenaria mercenaria]|uniref:uncharacterized protein LOC123551734 isoform X1 n=1 Tax=Mercenaria mercenaria TaxID=6596 RepID=UPI00234ED746|nr:uncharacterized protein LOC123551734 isoform X1 [Mercenaria mercenaria]XP_053392188.1 uncharacterized protein LOC123551734 isoform X1 [Mercenaria mercenaria]XP_053392189.1 uncharacterized protein LOC123551734 isoform X1 [Mercenaria mercenaria]XP_053392190.1 uncharacterized protein LOC123551734 isoform X1 [Mercenaria mercenaria]XP_053392191.1 uncharacterized protein LOC123551734 isoform X1 [Mercenaria mercenaria]XP_053392192.1 uncharacterized protein LOC123551734 isoform X1 [Mercenaria merce